MFIQQAFKVQHEFWRYLIVSVLLFAVHTIAQIPFMIAIFMKEGPEALSGISDTADLLSILESNTTLFLILLPFAVALLAFFLLLKPFHKQSIRSVTTARSKIDWGRVWFAFLLWAILTIVLTGVDYFLSPEDYVVNFKRVPFLILVLIACLLVPLQTSFEEYLFRGYLMQGFGVLAKNRWFPLMMTSVIFGALHFANPEVDKIGNIAMVYYIGTGLFLGIMTLMDDGIELAIGYHAANNLIAALLVTADWTVFKTNSVLRDISEPSTGIDILIPVLVVYPILLLVFARKYKWKNWDEKLFGRVIPPTESEVQP